MNMLKSWLLEIGKTVGKIFTLIIAAMFVMLPKSFQPVWALGAVDTTTFLNDAKIIYGALQNQVNQLAVVINLFGDGSKFGKPINNIGIRGYTFGARMGPNYNMGYRKEGTGGVGTAGNQNLKQATVVLKYAYVPIAITGQAENLTKGEGKAFMQAKALEAKFDMEDITKHVNVVVAGAERGGQLAVTSASAAGNFTCDNTGDLPGALYLRPGMPVDSGPVGGGANVFTNKPIASINYTTRVVTLVDGAAAAGVGNGIFLAGEQCLLADFPLTAECLQSLVSDTQALQGLDPAQSDQKAWASYVKSAAGALSPLLLTQLKMFVKNRGGKNPDMYLVPSAQIAQHVAVATGTLTYNVADTIQGVAKKAIDLGFNTFQFGGIPLIEEMDLRNSIIYCGSADSMKKFEALPLSMADDEAGTWTRINGGNGIADAVQGLLRWYHQLGITCRAEWSMVKNLTVPADFTQNPSSLA
jgi:hypothetical protein